jgi:hypothetical protein
MTGEERQADVGISFHALSANSVWAFNLLPLSCAER